MSMDIDTEPRKATDELSGKQKANLFRAALASFDAVSELEAAAVAERDKLSEVVRQIHSSCGSGPFTFKGRIVKIGRKTFKKGTDDEKTVYFFKRFVEIIPEKIG